MTRKIGECGAGEYDNFFKPGRQAQVPVEGETTEKNVSNNAGFLDFLQHGHVEAPEHNLSFVYNQLPKGQVFLTICVYETEDTKNHNHNVTSTTNSAEKVKTQLFRIDIPMKVILSYIPSMHAYNELSPCLINAFSRHITHLFITLVTSSFPSSLFSYNTLLTPPSPSFPSLSFLLSSPFSSYDIPIPLLQMRKELKAERLTVGHLAAVGITKFTPAQFEYIAENFRLATFFIEQPYVLIPYTSSCISIVMTVSQVTAFPRTSVLGQVTPLCLLLLIYTLLNICPFKHTL